MRRGTGGMGRLQRPTRIVREVHPVSTLAFHQTGIFHASTPAGATTQTQQHVQVHLEVGYFLIL